MLAVWAAFLSIGTIGLSQSEEKPVLLSGMVVDHVGAGVANLNIEISPRPAAQPEKQHTAMTAQTDYQGQFSASLLAGSYDVCVPRFPKSCRSIEIKPSVTPEYLALKISLADNVRVPVNPFEEIAGSSAKNCSHVLLNKNPDHATACAMRKFKHHKPFYVIYDEHCTDCISARGLAWNAKGRPYSISFDSMGYSF